MERPFVSVSFLFVAKLKNLLLLLSLFRRCYIRFIKKVNERKGMEGQEETRKAFDFMLSYLGNLLLSIFFIPSL